MGCLLDMFFEILIEGIFHLVMYVYLKLAYILVPQKQVTAAMKNKIKNTITTVTVLLALSLFLGIIFLLPNDATFNIIGKYMTLIPLSIIGLQIVLGIIVLIIRIVKRKN